MKYLTRLLPEMLDLLQNARIEKDFDTLCAVVHRLRGTATNYGFPRISAVADKCETTLRTQPTSENPPNESLDQLTNLVTMAIDTWKSEETS